MKMYHAFQPYMQYKSTYSIINNIACVLKISLMKNNPLLKELRESTDTQIRPVNCSTSGKRTAIYSSAPNHTSKYSVWWYVDHCLSFWAKPLHCVSFELRLFVAPLDIFKLSSEKRALCGLSETSRKYNTFKGQDVCECLVFAKFATMRKRQHPADHNDQQLVTDCSLWLIESQTKDQVPKRIKDKKWSTKYYTENSRVCYTTPTKTREWAQGLPFYLHDCFCASFLLLLLSINRQAYIWTTVYLTLNTDQSINQSLNATCHLSIATKSCEMLILIKVSKS